MMLPVAAAGMASKRIVTSLIMKCGYRQVLMVNTVLVGLTMASFSLTSAGQPLWLRLVQLAFFGGVNSIQFTAMNTLTLKDLGTGGASSGNSLFSLVQMLSMSLGVTIAGAVLATFTGMLPQGDRDEFAARLSRDVPVRRHYHGCVSVDLCAARAGDSRGEDDENRSVGSALARGTCDRIGDCHPRAIANHRGVRAALRKCTRPRPVVTIKTAITPQPQREPVSAGISQSSGKCAYFLLFRERPYPVNSVLPRCLLPLEPRSNACQNHHEHG